MDRAQGAPSHGPLSLEELAACPRTPLLITVTAMTFRNDASPADAALVTRSTTTAAEPGAVSSATLAHRRTALVAEGEPKEKALLQCLANL
jgi:hypothetical protein